jgi:hypothetical protein
MKSGATIAAMANAEEWVQSARPQDREASPSVSARAQDGGYAARVVGARVPRRMTEQGATVLQAAAIGIAGALIALTIALTIHWSSIVRTPPQSALRLNRWTAAVVICGGVPQPGWQFNCPVEFPHKAQ